MPVSDVRVPDGRIIEISHPEGATEEDIFAFAKYQYLKFEEPPERTMPVALLSEEEEDTGMLSDIAEFGQRTLGAAGRILGQSPAGLQSLFREGMEEDEELVERNRAIEESIRSWWRAWLRLWHIARCGVKRGSRNGGGDKAGRAWRDC